MKDDGKGEVPQGIIVWVLERSWMTEHLVGDWIKSVWFLITGAVMPAIHAGARQLPGPCHRKSERPSMTRELRLSNHTRRHDWDVAAT
jgi:hypothetical protein